MAESSLSMSYRAMKGLAREDGEFLHWVTELNQELPIFVDRTGPNAIEPVTLYQYMQTVLSTHANQPALAQKRGGRWVFWTYQNYVDQATQFAQALVHHGVSSRTCINIIGFNAPEWFISFFGATFADCVPVGVYTTSGPEACQYVANHSEVQLVVAQNEEQAGKYLQIWGEVPTLKAIVVYAPAKPEEFDTFRAGRSNVYTWDEFMALGTPNHATEVQQRLACQTPGSCLTLVYTSGTTGNPKGVMLSHDNYIWLAQVLLSLGDDLELTDNERIVSYLPLSHSAAQIADIFAPLVAKCCVYIAQEDALQGSLVDTLRDVRPTFFLGVPRVYEKIEEKLKSVAATKPGWMQAISGWAKQIGTQASDAMIKSQWPPFCFIPANLLILRNIKKAVGVDKVKAFTVGAAPMAKSTLEYFLSLNWIIVNMYGMSECGGPTTGSSLINANLFSAGYAFPGTQLVILDEKGNRLPTGERGEICFTGRNKFMGYYRNPESTRETIDVNGFIHSGDEGLIEADGSLHITGRFKELIITAGGENVPPVLIENDIKGRCRLINNVFVVGDNKKYLAALVTLKNEMDPLSGPSNVLSEESKAILASIGSSATDLQTAVVCEKVHKLVGEAITAYNEEGAISRAQQIRKWKILNTDFSIQGGELTPTMKIRRRIVADIHAAAIDSLYEEAKL